MARARRDQAILEGQSAVGLLAPQRLGQFLLGGSRPVVGDHRQHRIDHEVGRDTQLVQLLRALAQAQPLEHHQRIDDRTVAERIGERLAGVDGQERKLGADPAGLHPGATDMVDRARHRIDRAAGDGLHFRRPERTHFALMRLEPVADIGRLVGRALGIDHDR